MLGEWLSQGSSRTQMAAPRGTLAGGSVFFEPTLSSSDSFMSKSTRWLLLTAWTFWAPWACISTGLHWLGVGRSSRSPTAWPQISAHLVGLCRPLPAPLGAASATSPLDGGSGCSVHMLFVREAGGRRPGGVCPSRAGMMGPEPGKRPWEWGKSGPVQVKGAEGFDHLSGVGGQQDGPGLGQGVLSTR